MKERTENDLRLEEPVGLTFFFSKIVTIMTYYFSSRNKPQEKEEWMIQLRGNNYWNKVHKDARFAWDLEPK